MKTPRRAISRPALGFVCGAAFGLGLARTLFEAWPLSLSVLGDWPATLALAALCGLAVAALQQRAPAHSLAALAALALALPLVHALAPGVDVLRGATLLGGSVALFAVMRAAPASWCVVRGPLVEKPTGQLGNWSISSQRSVGHSTSQPINSYAPPAALFLFLSLFLLLFLIYLRTLAPSVGEADTFEFQVGIARLGVAHGSGYPLLMLVGKVFSLLPVGGTLAWRANLTSAFFGAAAGVGGALLARRLGASLLAAWLAGLAFGLSPTLWSRAVEVEAYTLNAALVAGLLYLCLSLLSRFSPPRLYAAAFLFGLSLTNHLTTLLLAPAIAAAIILKDKEREKDKESTSESNDQPTDHAPRTTNRAAWRVTGDGSHHLSRFTFHVSRAYLIAPLFLLLGLSVYLYIPIRWPAINNGEVLSLAQFANILAGNEARGAFQWRLPFTEAGRYGIVFGKVAGEYGWAGLALAVLGAAALLARGQARRLSVFGLAYLGYVFFALAFNVPDPDFSAFLIPLHLLAAAFMGVGVQALLDALSPERAARNQLPGWASPALSVFVLSAFALLPLSSLWRTLPRVDQSGDWARHRQGEFMLAQPLAPGATVLADSQKIAPLYYLQVAEGVRPDLDIVVLPDEAAYRAVLDERVAAGQTVYLGRYLPGLGSGYSLRSVGPLAEVSPAPFDAAPYPVGAPAEPLAVDGIELVGFTTPPDERSSQHLLLQAPEPLYLTLAWRAARVPEAHHLVYLRLVGASGAVAWRSAGSVPVGGLYPTNAWRAGEVVSDFHTVPVPHSLPPGVYRLEVGLFPPFAPGEAGWALLAEAQVLAPAEAPAIARPLRARFEGPAGAQWLLGYTAPETAAPGARVPVTLYWLHSGAQAVTAFGRTDSLDTWPPGSVAPVVYELATPAEGERLDLTLAAGQTARCGWLAPPTAACALPPVRLAGRAAAEGAVNFANLLLLNRAEVATSQAAPGGRVQVNLQWQGLQIMPDDYTVFVHLLGPDGRVHGQVDAWPVSGTQATSRWAPGAVINDPYSVPVEADAPPGDYQVEVGLYLLATGERLPVLNAEGAPIDDKVLLPGPTIASPDS